MENNDKLFNNPDDLNKVKPVITLCESNNDENKTKVKKRKNSDSRIWKSPLFYKFYLPIILLFIYLPILSLILFSFNYSNSLINFTGFSLKWYKTLFRNSTIMDALFTSLSVALLSTLISVVLGTLGSIGLSYFSKKHKFFRDSILMVNNIPVVSPDIVTAISLMVLFLGMSMPLGYGSMLLAHISFCTPYVVLSVYPKMSQIDKNLVEASMDLGATKSRSLVKVILPELLPSIVSGAMMAFTMSFDDFVISYFVGGSQVNISTYLYSLKKSNPQVNALSTIIILIVLSVLLFSQLIQHYQTKRGLQAKDINGTNITNTNLERKLVPNGSKEALEVIRANEVLDEIDASNEEIL